MEQFDQLEGFDLENTSQYSSFNPTRSIKNAGTDIYNFVNKFNPLPTLDEYTNTSYQNIKDATESGLHGVKNVASSGFHDVKNVATTGFDNIKNLVKTEYDNVKNSINNINANDFYASDPNQIALRDSMQSQWLPTYNGNLDTNLNVLQNNMVPNHGQQLVKQKDTTSVNYNSLLLVVILLIIFLLWRYYSGK